MTRRICPIPHCETFVGDAPRFLCVRHWNRVPGPTRAAIWRSYRQGNAGTPEHRGLVMEAIREVRALGRQQ